jgi:hypothetical protein
LWVRIIAVAVLASIAGRAEVFAAAAGAHLLHGVWDTGAAGLPAWMRRLRAIGTFGAAAALLAGGAVYLA